MTQQRVVRIAMLIGIFWIVGQAVFQVAVATAPLPAFYWLNAANLLQSVAVMSAVALLLVTNTRRPKGIDPDAPPEVSIPQRPIIAYDTKGQPYGRRTDDVNPDLIGLVLAALRDLPPEARSSMLGLGVVTDPAELKALQDMEAEDHASSDRPAWADELLERRGSPNEGENNRR